jgi:hypothetical protein
MKIKWIRTTVLLALMLIVGKWGEEADRGIAENHTATVAGTPQNNVAVRLVINLEASALQGPDDHVTSQWADGALRWLQGYAQPSDELLLRRLDRDRFAVFE